MCNEATVECKGGHFKAVGAPTEAALVVLAEKLGVPDANDHSRLRQLRANNPELNPTPISKHYASRHALLVACLGLPHCQHAWLQAVGKCSSSNHLNSAWLPLVWPRLFLTAADCERRSCRCVMHPLAHAASGDEWFNERLHAMT